MILSALRKFQIKLSLNSKNGEMGITVRNPSATLYLPSKKSSLTRTNSELFSDFRGI